MKFSTQLWQMVSPIYQKILNQPFIEELSNGSLNFERFNFFLKQDSYYLIEFSKALAIIATRSNSISMVNKFLNFSLNAIVTERGLHAHFLSDTSNPAKIEISPACIAYTRFLIATASTATLEEAVAAVLPCFWIYREVGNYIKETSSKDNPYARWIDNYSSQEFSAETDKAISMLDDLAIQSSPQTQMLMAEAFEYCSLYEWHFWNDAYNMVTFRGSYLSESLKY